MVRGPEVSFVRDAMASAVAPRPADTGEGRNLPSSSSKVEPSCLAPEREHLLGEGLPLEVVEVIQNARAPSTRTLYSYK